MNNREFKFRAFWGDTKKLIPDFMDQYDLFHLNDEHIISHQWVGLLDRNSKEMYEGDIVKVKRGFTRPYINDKNKIDYKYIDGEEEIGVIIMMYHTAAFMISYEHIRGDDYDEMKSGYNIEVIGNEVQNPELLKKVVNNN
jgi:uncharacterized phage protein (TIGR01671 family)